MRCCTFAGHREVLERGIEDRIAVTIGSIIEAETNFCFYTGGMGEFDQMCASVVRRMKREYTNKEIRLVLVEPYMKQSINTYGIVLAEQYDEILIPTEWADCHYKKAITYRNQWMVDHSQHMIAYVGKNYGGAYASMRYAQKKGLTIMNLYQNTNTK